MLRFFLKLAVSIALLSIVLSRVDIGAVGQTLARANGVYIGLALLLSLAMAAAEARQWQSVLASLGHRISYRTALLYSLLGTFFGNFGPSGMDVDIYLATQMRIVGIPIGSAVRAVLGTRLMAFVALLVVIATGMPIVFSFPLEPREFFVFGFVFVSALGALCGIMFLESVRRHIPILQRFNIVRKFAQVSKDLARALSSWHYTALSLFYSTLPHVLRILIFAAIGAALNANMSFAALYALVPMALLVAMIPITLASWGMREISIVFFLGWAGAPADVALSISIAFGISQLVMAAIGGIMWVFARAHHYHFSSADASD